MPNAQAINLKNNIEVFVVLDPLPHKRKDGSYRGYLGGQQQPDVYYTFKMSGRVIAPKMPSHLVFNDRGTLTICQGIILDTEDMCEIDRQGWEIMRQYGMFPTVWVDPLHLANV